jgi:hypothetical protein
MVPGLDIARPEGIPDRASSMRENHPIPAYIPSIYNLREWRAIRETLILWFQNPYFYSALPFDPT